MQEPPKAKAPGTPPRPADRHGLSQAGLKRFWVFLCQSTNSITRHQTLTMASALAFSSLTATVPMLLIGLAVATVFGTEDGRSYADLFILSVQERLPDTPELQPLFDILRTISARSSEIAGIGLALLFITAYALLSSVEYAFNRIWQVTAQRSVFNRAIAYLATIIVVPVLMSFSVYFSSRVETVARKFATTIEQDGLASLFRFSHDKRPGFSHYGSGSLGFTPLLPPEPALQIPLRPAGTQTLPPMIPALSSPLASPPYDFPPSAAPVPPSAPAADAGLDIRPKPGASAAYTTPEAQKNTPTHATAPGSPVHQPYAQALPLKLVLGALSLAFTCGALTLLFHFMPYTPVRWRAAIYGGLFSGVLIELTKYTFSYYAQNATTSLTRLYGTTLLAFPLALLWLWLIWVLILLGAEVAFNLQNYRDLAASAEIEKKGLPHRLYLAVRTVLVSCELFHTGGNPAGLVGRAAERLGVPEFAIRTIVQQLAEKKVLRPILGLEDAYLPGRDIQTLTLQMVVDAMAGDTFSCPQRSEAGAHQLLAGLFAETSGQVQAQFDSLTMQRLLELEGFLTVPGREP